MHTPSPLSHLEVDVHSIAHYELARVIHAERTERFRRSVTHRPTRRSRRTGRRPAGEPR